MTDDELERFMSYVDLKNCWNWTGGKTGKGYGQFYLRGKNLRAHRASYEHFIGEIGDLQVLHECDNPSCVNPDHLFLGTNQDNRHDSVDKKRHNIGSRNGMSTLSPREVEWIREDSRKYSEIAKAFCVSEQTIGRIKRGETYV